MGFFIHWNESAMDLHVFPIPIPPPISPSRKMSVQVFLPFLKKLIHLAWSFITAHRLSSHGTQAPECTDFSSYGMCRLSCSKACGIIVPQPGLEPTSPALQGKFLITRPRGKPSPTTHFWIWFSCRCFLEVSYILWILVHYQTNDLQGFSPIL